MFFEYTEDQIKYLESVDEKLGFLIGEIGDIKREINTNHFIALINHIIGQQISKNAAISIGNKFSTLLDDITPQNILAKPDADLRNCGLSFRKVEYIKNIAVFAIENPSFFNNIESLTDEEIYNSLIGIKGIGKWTIEMLLIFSLNRENVLSYNDLIIKKSLIRLHNLNTLDKKTFDTFKNLYSPYCSLASLYLWEFNSRKDLEDFPF